MEHSGKKSYRGKEVNFLERRVIEYDMSNVWEEDYDNDTDFSFAATECDIEGKDGGKFTFHIKGTAGEEVIEHAKDANCSKEFIELIRNAKCWGVHWVRFNI